MFCARLVESSVYRAGCADTGFPPWLQTVCEGWIPVEEIDNLKVAVAEATRHSGAQPVIVQLLERKKTNAPPTYFKLNKFTANFQGIVDTYGVPRYQEVNPGLFTIVTFPFLFGVMYGDVGTFNCCHTFAGACESPTLGCAVAHMLTAAFSLGLTCLLFLVRWDTRSRLVLVRRRCVHGAEGGRSQQAGSRQETERGIHLLRCALG